MDPRTKDYALVAGQDYRRRPLDAAWALGGSRPRSSAPAPRLTSASPRSTAGTSPPPARAEEVRRGIAERVGEPAPERRPEHDPDCPGGVHEPEAEAERKPGELGPVGRERHAGREQRAERDRRGDGDDDEQDRARDPGEERRRRSGGDSPTRIGSKRPCRSDARPTKRVDADLGQAGDDEDGADREGAPAGVVKGERGEHVQHAEEERGQRAEPEPDQECGVRERRREPAARRVLLARRRVQRCDGREQRARRRRRRRT